MRQGPSGDQTPVLGSSLRNFIQPRQAVGANAPVYSHDAAELCDGEERHGGAHPEGSPAPGAGPCTDRGLVDKCPWTSGGTLRLPPHASLSPAPPRWDHLPSFLSGKCRPFMEVFLNFCNLPSNQLSPRTLPSSSRVLPATLSAPSSLTSTSTTTTRNS